MQTLTTMVARQISARATIYNDRMTDGRRSLKVPNWMYADYMEASKRLINLGCDVEFNSRSKSRCGFRVSKRLYVREPS